MFGYSKSIVLLYKKKEYLWICFVYTQIMMIWHASFFCWVSLRWPVLPLWFYQPNEIPLILKYKYWHIHIRKLSVNVYIIYMSKTNWWRTFSSNAIESLQSSKMLIWCILLYYITHATILDNRSISFIVTVSTKRTCMAIVCLTFCCKYLM